LAEAEATAEAFATVEALLAHFVIHHSSFPPIAVAPAHRVVPRCLTTLGAFYNQYIRRHYR